MTEPLDAILARRGRSVANLLPILQDAADDTGYLAPEAVTRISRELGTSRAHVEGVIGFYSFLSERPRGLYRVLFSDNITDEMAGAHALQALVRESFGCAVGGVSPDALVSVGTTSCTGLCDQGPALLVNGRPIGGLSRERLGVLLALMRSRVPVSQWPPELFEISSHLRRQDRLLSTPLAPGAAVESALRRGGRGMVEELRTSGLRGRGGAGFVTATKWEACRGAPGSQKVVVCNADEGEPGTFKDRELLRHRIQEVIEGMSVAAACVGAELGFIYLRAEYPFLVEPIVAALATRRAQGLLGPSSATLFGHPFEIELRLGAGAYVCGEESALLESLEGRRGIPRKRPPFPVTSGYLGRPTIVSNVETYINAAHVALGGGEWLRAVGTEKSAGTKVLSVSGDVSSPGIYEVPFGVSIEEVLNAAGARIAQAVSVGGPSGVLIGAREFQRRLAFEDIPSAGAFMVFDDTRDPLAVVHNFARFFAHESCGFCTPCRVGTTLVQDLVQRLVDGRGARRDLVDLGRVSALMRSSSHCGLGTTASNPVRDLMTKFSPLVESRLLASDSVPTFDLEASLAPAREATGRLDAAAHWDGSP